MVETKCLLKSNWSFSETIFYGSNKLWCRFVWISVRQRCQMALSLMLLYFKAQIPMWLEFREWNLLQWFFVKPDQISDNDSFRTFDVLYEGTTNQSEWQQKGVRNVCIYQDLLPFIKSYLFFVLFFYNLIPWSIWLLVDEVWSGEGAKSTFFVHK